MAALGTPAAAEDAPPPIRFHVLFHAAIRAELDRLDEEVKRLETQTTACAEDIDALALRCRFLHDVYQYHSRLEDEVSSRLVRLAPAGRRLACVLHQPVLAVPGHAAACAAVVTLTGSSPSCRTVSHLPRCSTAACADTACLVCMH